MKKIKLGTSDGATENAKRITELFPQVVTEIKSADGEIERTIILVTILFIKTTTL